MHIGFVQIQGLLPPKTNTKTPRPPPTNASSFFSDLRNGFHNALLSVKHFAMFVSVNGAINKVHLLNSERE